MKADAILLLSGGIDSTVVLDQLRNAGRRAYALIFDYGQTLAVELKYAIRNAQRCNAYYSVVLTPLTDVAPLCALLKENHLPLPHGRSVAEIALGGTPPSYVPFRNGIFLAYAVALGESMGVQEIFCGGNGLASGNYWDDTHSFARRFQQAADEGTAPTYHPRIRFPLAGMTKADVVGLAAALGTPLTQTLSCYTPTPDGQHCRQCDSCVQRAAALAANSMEFV